MAQTAGGLPAAAENATIPATTAEQNQRWPMESRGDRDDPATTFAAIVPRHPMSRSI